jgi:peroxiredoxin Q/BCP
LTAIAEDERISAKKSESQEKPMNKKRLSIATCCLGLFLCAESFAQRGAEPAASQPASPLLEAGATAPGFAVPKPGRPGDSEELLRLDEFRGKKNVILAFYPKAFTGGCTKQMCGYRDDYSEFKDADTEVIAVSLDDQELSDKFKIYHNLPFPVLGDADGKIAKSYGVPLKEFSGGKITLRTTFVIDKQGVIRQVFPQYDIQKDKDVLRDVIQELNSEQSGKSPRGGMAKAATAPADRRSSR